MNNIFTNKKIYQMLGSQGPAKTRAERRLEKTKGKAEDAKDATRGKKSSDSKKVIRQANKAKRLDKRVKRQEGRAERKKLRKTTFKDFTPEQKRLSATENAERIKGEIKDSRKKQKVKTSNKVNSSQKGPYKTGEPTFTKKKKKSSGYSNLTKIEQLAKPVLGILAGNWHPKIKAANEKKSRQMHAKKNASSGGQGSKK